MWDGAEVFRQFVEQAIGPTRRRRRPRCPEARQQNETVPQHSIRFLLVFAAPSGATRRTA